MQKPASIQNLEQQLAPFGFVPVNFIERKRELTELRDFSGKRLLCLNQFTSAYGPGWRFIETVRPPETYKSVIAYRELISKIGIDEALKQREKYIKVDKNKYPETMYPGAMIVADTYQNDPFFEILCENWMGRWDAGGYAVAKGGRGMFIPQLIEKFLPKIAEKIGIAREKVRLPYGDEFLQCLQPDGLLHWWPEYYVSEWLQDFERGPGRNGEPYSYYGIIHSLSANFPLEKETLYVSTSLNDNHDTGSDRYNPACGFRLVVEP